MAPSNNKKKSASTNNKKNKRKDKKNEQAQEKREQTQEGIPEDITEGRAMLKTLYRNGHIPLPQYLQEDYTLVNPRSDAQEEEHPTPAIMYKNIMNNPDKLRLFAQCKMQLMMNRSPVAAAQVAEGMRAIYGFKTDEEIWEKIAMLSLAHEREQEVAKLPAEERNTIKFQDAKCASKMRSSKKCDECLAPSADLMWCSACSCRVYCSQACQKVAWTKSHHRKECKLLKATLEIPQGSPFYRDKEGKTVLGVIATQNHGSWFVVLESLPGPQDAVHGDELGGNFVPLAHLKLRAKNGVPTCVETATCLHDAMKYPLFDTFAGGRRRPSNITIIESTPNFSELAALCLRLGVTVKQEDTSYLEERDTHNKDAFGYYDHKECFIAYMGWTDEIAPEERRSLLWNNTFAPNGMTRYEMEPFYEKWNQLATNEALSKSAFPTRKEVEAMPGVSMDDVPEMDLNRGLGAVCLKGVLYVFENFEPHKLLYHGRVILEESSRRPSVDQVARVICQAIKEHYEFRPASLRLGKPSIVSETDAEIYISDLSSSLVRDACVPEPMRHLEDLVSTKLIGR